MQQNTSSVSINPLRLLARRDKWYLGGGNRVLWAPPFPLWLDSPGFWDKASYYNFDFEPVFTWTLLDDTGREISIRGRERSWTPQELLVYFECPGHPGMKRRSDHLQISERKACLPDDVLASEISIRNLSSRPRTVHLIVWTVQPNDTSPHCSHVEGIRYNKGRIQFIRRLYRVGPGNSGSPPAIRVACSLGIDRKIESYAINLSEGTVLQPSWQLTPFAELFRNGKLPGQTKTGSVSTPGLVFIGLHALIRLAPGTVSKTVASFALRPAGGKSAAVHFPAGKKSRLESSWKNWSRYFARVPEFSSSDEFLTRYYWYRWYGLRLLTLHGKEGHYMHPAVCEGIGYFRAPISYSAMCHMRENRWLPDPVLAQGSLLTFLDNQRRDGGFRGYIDPFYYRQEMFYHANWGNSLRELHRIHPDLRFLRQVYDGLAAYVRYFDRERDEERSGLYDIDNHYETGQEYMHRYLAVNPRADRDNWGEVFRLKGVDVTVYLYELKGALAWIARTIGLPAQIVNQWEEGQNRIREAVLGKMWDPEEEMFFDVEPATGRRTKVKAAVCFYPYATDLVDRSHLDGLKRHLLNPREFWTPYPLPSSSCDDPYFSATPEWKGKRMNCPWNGRVWPMTDSHIAEALAMSAIRFQDNDLRVKTAEFISKFIRMMFFEGDPARPNCFEHYNPFTGEPSVYRGVDDYQHSWVNDLILKYVVGIRPGDGSVTIDPFPFECEEVGCRKILIRGSIYEVSRKGETVRIRISGGGEIRSRIGIPVVHTLR